LRGVLLLCNANEERKTTQNLVVGGEIQKMAGESRVCCREGCYIYSSFNLHLVFVTITPSDRKALKLVTIIVNSEI